jgi:hypothetical protein
VLLSTIARLGLSAVVATAPAVVGSVASGSSEPPPVRYAAMTGPDDRTDKVVTVSCPYTDQAVYAAGARVIGGDGQVVLTAAVPDPTLSGVTAAARARAGYSGAWALVAYAVCDRSPFQPTREAQSADGQMNVTATCPGAGRLTGTGFRFEGSVDHLGLTEVTIGPGIRSVRVGVGGPATPERVTAFGICRPVTPDETPARDLLSDAESADQWPASAVVEESLSDMTVFGVGASVSGPGNPFLTALVPNPDLGRAVAEAAGGDAVSGFASMADDGDDGEVSVTALVLGVFH